MKNYRKHIDDFFREKLGNYRETPPADAWEELEGRLDCLTPATPVSPYRWMWHAAIISLLLVLGVSAGRNLLNTSHTIADAGNATQAGNTTGPNSSTNANTNISTGAPEEGNVTGTNSNTSTNSNTVTNSNVQGVNPVATPNSSYASGNGGTGNVATRPNALVAAQGQKANSIRTKRNRRSSNRQPAYASNHNGFTHESDNSLKPQNEPVYNEPADPASPSNNSKEPVSPGLNPSSPDNTRTSDSTGTKDAGKSNPNDGSSSNDKAPIASRSHDSRFSAGVKAGYEAGLYSNPASKMVVAPYLQYKLSKKVSLMLQPAVKSAGMSTRDAGSTQSYYNTNEATITRNTTPFTFGLGPGDSVTHYSNSYTYSQTHDSIVKSHKYGGQYMEFELPVLLNYSISNKVSAYGGVNVVYSQTLGYTEKTYTQPGIRRSVTTGLDTTNYVPTTTPDFPTFKYAGSSIQNYKNPYPTQPGNQINVGYMVGVTYTAGKKWLIDALVQQTPVNTSGNAVSTPLSNAYFRLSVGYKITK